MKTCTECGYRHWQAGDHCDTCRQIVNKHHVEPPKPKRDTVAQCLKIERNLKARMMRETK